MSQAADSELVEGRWPTADEHTVDSERVELRESSNDDSSRLVDDAPVRAALAVCTLSEILAVERDERRTQRRCARGPGEAALLAYREQESEEVTSGR